MPKSGRKKTLLVLAAVTAFAVSIALVIGGVVHPPATDTHQAAANPNEAIERYLQDHTEVITHMDDHAQSKTVFQELVALWSKAANKDPNDVPQEIALAFPDHTLGLYALRSLLAEQPTPNRDATPFCRLLIKDHPDTRVACMALDHLLASVPDEATTICSSLAAGATDTRVARFALMTVGDRHAQKGEPDAAISAWIKAWIAQPDLGAKVYNKLCGLWLQKKDWFPPLILGGEYINDPALNPLKERLLALYQDRVGQTDRGRVGTRIGEALGKNELDGLCGVLEAVYNTWPNLQISDAEKTELALAIFFVGGASDHTISLPLGSALALENRFTACRRRALALALESREAIAPDLMAFYTLRVARRMMSDIQVKPALDTLQDSWKRESLSGPWRERLVSCYADILATEYHQPNKSADTYVTYCESYNDAPNSFLSKSALLYVQSESYENAQTQFARLEEKATNNDEKALACFMQGICMMHADNRELAKDKFEKVTEQYPTSEFGPKALAQLGIIALKDDNREKAREYFQQIAQRYPDWKDAAYYGNMAASLSASQ